MQQYTKREQYDLLYELAQKLVNSLQFYYRHPKARVQVVEGNTIWTLSIAGFAKHPDVFSPEFSNEVDFQHQRGVYENLIDNIQSLKVYTTYDPIHNEERGAETYIVGKDLDNSELNKVDLFFKKTVRLPLRKAINKFLHSDYIKEKNSEKRSKNVQDAYRRILEQQSGTIEDTIKELLEDYLDILKIKINGEFVLVQVKEELRSKEDVYRVYDGDSGYEIVEFTRDEDD